MPTHDPPHPPDASFRELVAERLLLLELNAGRIRAVLETLPSTDREAGPAPITRLTLLDPRGEPALVAEIDPQGEPVLHVGHPDRGISVVISSRGLDAWAGGNVVASLRSEDGVGRLELADADGEVVVSRPGRRKPKS
jgi:hypothetical protein